MYSKALSFVSPKISNIFQTTSKSWRFQQKSDSVNNLQLFICNGKKWKIIQHGGKNVNTETQGYYHEKVTPQTQPFMRGTTPTTYTTVHRSTDYNTQYILWKWSRQIVKLRFRTNYWSPKIHRTLQILFSSNVNIFVMATLFHLSIKLNRFNRHMLQKFLQCTRSQRNTRTL